MDGVTGKHQVGLFPAKRGSVRPPSTARAPQAALGAPTLVATSCPVPRCRSLFVFSCPRGAVSPVLSGGRATFNHRSTRWAPGPLGPGTGSLTAGGLSSAEGIHDCRPSALGTAIEQPLVRDGGPSRFGSPWRHLRRPGIFGPRHRSARQLAGANEWSRGLERGGTSARRERSLGRDGSRPCRLRRVATPAGGHGAARRGGTIGAS